MAKTTGIKIPLRKKVLGYLLKTKIVRIGGLLLLIGVLGLLNGSLSTIVGIIGGIGSLADIKYHKKEVLHLLRYVLIFLPLIRCGVKSIKGKGNLFGLCMAFAIPIVALTLNKVKLVSQLTLVYLGVEILFLNRLYPYIGGLTKGFLDNPNIQELCKILGMSPQTVGDVEVQEPIVVSVVNATEATTESHIGVNNGSADKLDIQQTNKQTTTIF
jgi:hypothetical protein